jgi:hypothetical protein
MERRLEARYAPEVPHEFDADGDLVCYEKDEQQVELIIDDSIARAANRESREDDSCPLTAEKRSWVDAELTATMHALQTMGPYTRWALGLPQWVQNFVLPQRISFHGCVFTRVFPLVLVVSVLVEGAKALGGP